MIHKYISLEIESLFKGVYICVNVVGVILSKETKFSLALSGWQQEVCYKELVSTVYICDAAILNSRLNYTEVEQSLAKDTDILLCKHKGSYFFVNRRTHRCYLVRKG